MPARGPEADVALRWGTTAPTASSAPHPGPAVAGGSWGREAAVVGLPGHLQPLASGSHEASSHLLLVFEDQDLCPGEITFLPASFCKKLL